MILPNQKVNSGMMENLNLSSRPSIDLYLTPAVCDFFCQAAAVCLDNQGHAPGVILTVTGDLTAQFQLFWEPVTQRMRDSFNDLQYATEAGAYCLSILIIQKLTAYQVIRQSQKGTGFDFWLGDKQDQYPFTNTARLEVSGILTGNKPLIQQRATQKIAQTKPSDNLNLPAYVAVVEFSAPLLQWVLKQ